VTQKASPWTKERRFGKTGRIVPFPETAVVYLAPPSNRPDIPALELASVILSGGESSRLNESLVRDQQTAQEAEFGEHDKLDGGLLYFMGIASEGHNSAETEKAWYVELKKNQDKGVTAKELEKAKNQLITRALRMREDNDGRAIAIEQAIAYQGDAKAVNKDIDALNAVTVADIQRVMNKYINDNNRVVIFYNQAAKAEGEGNEK